MKLTKLTLLIFILAFLFSSCKKYEEGPILSTFPKKTRLTNYWHKLDASGDIPIEGTHIHIQNDGYFEIISDSYSERMIGTWEWGDNKEYITVETDEQESGSYYEGSSSKTFTFQISKLKLTELIISGNGHTYNCEASLSFW